MANEISIQHVIDAVAGKTNRVKLRQVTRLLQAALGGSLAEQPFSDPMIVRRRLVVQLRKEGASAGTIQALEQFFMGIVRRAAIGGLIPAPPEGPWTRAWQGVLTASPRLRSQVRSFAAWATERELEPADVSDASLDSWGENAGCDDVTLAALQELIAGAVNSSYEQESQSSSVLTMRLRLKASHGTVRNSRE